MGLSRRKTLLAVALLSGLGCLGNVLALPMAFGVAFIFGSIFSIIALRRLGLGWGIVVTIAASCYTLFLWNHPYAIAIFTAEALWIGMALRRGKSNILLIDSVYWLVLGMPLVVLFYAGVMHLGAQSTAIIVLKQSLNGIFNALVAGILLSHTPVGRWFSPAKPQPLPYSTGIFHLVAAFLMVPSLGMLLWANYHEINDTQERIVQELRRSAHKSEAMVAHWVEQHVNAVRVIAELGAEAPLMPSPRLQEELGRIIALFPDFHNVFLGDAEATTVAFFPAVNERGESTIGINFADRAWFKDLSRTLQPVISDIFLGRGGVFAPIFTIGVPFVKAGQLTYFGLGAINIERMRDLFKLDENCKDMVFTVLDRNSHVVVSSTSGRRQLDSFLEQEVSHQRIAADVSLRVPGSPKNISIMQGWKDASYCSTLPIRGTSWTLLLEYPVAPRQQHFYQLAIWSLGVVWGLFGGMISFASFISRRLTRPLHELSQVSRDIPERIDRDEIIAWPNSATLEISELTDNFSQTAAELYARILQIRDSNRELEQRVEERTAELNVERQRLAHILYATNVGTWEWNIQTGALILNERWAEIIGYRLAELEPVAIHTWREHTHPEDVKRIEALLQRHFSGELDGYSCEFRMRHKDGQWVWMLDRGKVVVWTAEGQPLLMSGTHQDISIRKAQEADLRQAKEEAEAANRAKSEFLANMSHEIRTPMNGVIGMCQLLEMTDLTAEQQECVEGLKRSGSNLLELINDILDLSKVEAGKIKLDQNEFKLRQCLHNVVKPQQALTQSKGLFLQVEIDEKIPQVVLGDSMRTQQILLNLLGNAVKFTAQGGITLEVQLIGGDSGSVVVQFSVRDTGIGIAADVQEKIFDPFAQGDGSITRQFGGTGLGLAITRQLVELMDGTLSVESTPGVGSCFKVALPFGLSSQTVAIPAPSARVENLSEVPSLRILFVEDNAINIKIGTTLLKKLGHRVSVAENGRLCLAALEQDSFDLVLMDVQMPIMDGLTATREIRHPQSRVLNHAIPIIAMTANAMQGDREKCLSAGMDDYLAKPLTLKGLTEQLSAWATRKASCRDEADGETADPAPTDDVSAEPPVFDRAGLLDRLMDDLDLARTFAQDFLHSMPRHFEAMRVSLEAGDAQGVVFQAHGIKGAAAMVGGEALRAVALAIEQAAEAGDLALATKRMDAMAAELNRLQQAINRELESTES